MTPVRIKGEQESPNRKRKVSVSSTCGSSSMLDVKHEEPSSVMSEESKSLKSESEFEERKEDVRENGEKECTFERSKEDSVETQRFANSSAETIVYRPDDDMFEEGEKGEKNAKREEIEERMDLDATAEKEPEEHEKRLPEREKGEVVESEEETAKETNVVSQDIFADIESNVGKRKSGSDSDDSQTLTADSKTPIADNLSQSMLVPNLSSEALELKKKVLDSSSSSSEKSANSSLSESSNSDSDLSSGEVLKKLSSSAKKRAKMVHSKKSSKISDEDRELNRLTNLNTLRRRLKFSSLDEDECDDDSGTWLKKQGPKKEKKPKENGVSLLDMLHASDESDQEVPCSEEAIIGDPVKEFWKSNNDMLKEVVLASSGSSSDSSVTSDSMLSKKKKKKYKRIDSDSSRKSRPSWMNDPLLRGKLSESDEEDKKEKDSDVILESSDEKAKTDTEKPEKDAEKPKKKRRRRIRDSDIESTDSSEIQEEYVSPVKSQETPSKGRKNIRKILMKDSLTLSTRQAIDLENRRKKRIQERKKVYDELFPPSEDTLILDYDPVTKKPLLAVHKKLVKNLKPHQREGVKFMWDSCFESLKRLEEESGSGCILAHCMGLGKTLQAIALSYTLLTNNTGVHTVLIVCPMNTVPNWRNEFRIWLKNLDGKRIQVYDLNNNKKPFQRSYKLLEWHENGGVMIISYPMFRILTTDLKNSPLKKFVKDFDRALIDPGPDLIICDEGHTIKNDHAGITKCMRRIKTSRRILLTGTPLQNNLNEYYWMVDFIKPKILGTAKEFRNRFLHPIDNGQFKDSTQNDVNIMKKRSHVLHTLLDGCIQRYDYSVLTPFLPEKQEYVISISLMKTQAKLYEHYLSNSRSSGKLATTKIFKDYNCLLRVWTHPYTLRAHSEKEAEDRKKPRKSQNSARSLENENPDCAIMVENEHPDTAKMVENEGKINEDWWKGLIPEEEFEDVNSSGKLVLLFSILAKAQEIGDKVLVFSTSLYALDMIQYFLNKRNWIENYDYFKLVGNTTSDNRTRCCNLFNQKENKRARLFLISTKAGGLGINLVGANRVVIFDASWNPSHDVQSIFRVYRFGQTKTCYIYRFLAEATMEEKIYERQVSKLSLADRVVDEHQIDRHYTMGDLRELYNYSPVPPEDKVGLIPPKDKLLADIIMKHNDIIVNYHDHVSLLENREEEELTEEERRAAWEEFEKEKYTYENRVEPPPAANALQNQANPQDLHDEVATIYPNLDADNLVNGISKMIQLYKNPLAQPNASDDSVSNIRIDKVESLSNMQQGNR